MKRQRVDDDVVARDQARERVHVVTIDGATAVAETRGDLQKEIEGAVGEGDLVARFAFGRDEEVGHDAANLSGPENEDAAWPPAVRGRAQRRA